MSSVSIAEITLNTVIMKLRVYSSARCVYFDFSQIIILNVRTPQHVYTLHGCKLALAALCHNIVTPI